MAEAGPALQEKSAQYFCRKKDVLLSWEMESSFVVVKAGLEEAQLLCVNWSAQAKGVFNRAENCCGHPPRGLKRAKLKHRVTWQMCLEVTRG